MDYREEAEVQNIKQRFGIIGISPKINNASTQMFVSKTKPYMSQHKFAHGKIANEMLFFGITASLVAFFEWGVY